MTTYPLTHSQKRIWYSEKLNPGMNAYNLSFSFRFDNPVNFSLLEKAINQVIQDHDGLRLFFTEEEGPPAQAVREYRPVSIPFMDFTRPGGASRETEWIKEETRAPISLNAPALYRFYLLRYSNGEEGFLMNIHHITCDGWTIVLLGDQIQANYNKLLWNATEPSGESPSYLEFLKKEKEYLESERFQNNRRFWTEYFTDLPDFLNFPVKNGGKGVEKAQRYIRYLSEEYTQKLYSFCSNEHISPFLFFFSILSIYLYRVTGQEDFIIGTATHNRIGSQEKQTAGMFVNLLACRQKVTGDTSFQELTKRTSREFIRLFRNQKYPFDLLMEDIRLKHDYKEDLFKVVFSYENKSSAIRNFWNFNGVESFPLVIHLVEREGSERLKWEIDYKENLFRPEEIKSLCDSLMTLAAEGMTHPATRITQLELVAPEEKEMLLNRFNKTLMAYPKDSSLSELFEEQVRKTPEKTALVYGKTEIIYSELEIRVNSLAGKLLAEDLKKNTVVGILAHPCPEMIIAILAILRAGGTYLPIDPSYPKDRISYILDDSRAGILLLQRGLSGIRAKNVNNLFLEEVTAGFSPTKSVFPRKEPESPAYIIYTSGSTGLPKGVVVENRNLLNLCFWHKTRFRLTSEDRTTKYAGVSFDASVWEIFPTLLSGAALYILDQETRMDLRKLNQYMEENQITVSFLPTAVCEPFTRLKNNSLRTLLTGGDRLNSYEPQSYELVNNYGPTETTVVATSCALNSSHENIPIGAPIANTRIYILDENRKTVPLGIPGELCIGGDGVARGYLNRPELTAEKFIPHPFVPGERIYRTGDLARWLPDGTIEFIGRLDQQLKIRGFRIEPGEIEAALLKDPKINEASVAAVEEPNGKYLCAYILSKEEIDEQELRRLLTKQLPDYMIPTYFIPIDELPLTANGKIDKKALPEPERRSSALASSYKAPNTDKEKLLAQVWEKILGQYPIGVKDNFFYRGGDSIKAIQLSSELQQKGYRMEIADLYETPVIESLQFSIRDLEKHVSQKRLTGTVELSPIQSWFFQQSYYPVHHWNQWVTIDAPANGRPEVIRQALETLVLHHDMLRSVYPDRDKAVIRGNEPELFHFALAPEEEHQKLHSVINIDKGPLLSAGLDCSASPARLSLIAHHLVVDGLSWRILLEDLRKVCRQIQTGKKVSLPPKTDSFLSWMESLRSFSTSHLLEKEIPYWQAREKETLPTLRPAPLSRDPVKADISLREIRLSRTETESLLKEAHYAYNTQINDLLLCALLLAFREWSGDTVLFFNMEGHGREDLGEGLDLSRTVGWFTAVYPVILKLPKEKSLSSVIAETKETLRKIPRKGIGYGILRYMQKEGLRWNRAPEISFNYLGIFDGKTGIRLSMAPDCPYPYALDLNGLVEEDSFRLLFHYDSRRFSSEMIRDLAEHYRTSLLKIIRHCTSRKEQIKTASDYGDVSLTEEEIKRLPQGSQRVYPLTPLQEGMLLSHIREPGTGAYFEQMSFILKNSFDLSLFQKRWETFIERHDILRTVFSYEKMRKPRQIVLDRIRKPLVFHDIRHFPSFEKSSFAENIKQQDRKSPFSLKDEPPYRLTILQEENTRCRFIFSFHHILMDGWSLGIVLRELFLDFRPVKGDYYQYLQWRERQNQQEAARYWKEYLDGYERAAVLPDRHVPRGAFRQEEISFALEKETTDRLTKWARETGVTQAALFQAAWGLLLQQYNRSEDTVFGFVLSGRPSELPDSDKMLGLFINTIPVRVITRPGMTVSDLVVQAQKNFSESEKYNSFSLAEIQAQSGFRDGLFTHIVSFENYPLPLELKTILTDLEIFEQAEYDFNLLVLPGKSLEIRVRYNEEVFREQQIRETGFRLLTILRNICRQGDIPLEKLTILDGKEEEQLLRLSRGPTPSYPSGTIHRIFEKRAGETPEKTALIFKDEKMTYRELNRKANALAAYLIHREAAPQSLVAIHMHRSFEMVIAILGILKARCAYLPIDPDMPEERKRQILDDSGAGHMIVREDRGSLDFFSGAVRSLGDFPYEDYGKIPLRRQAESSDPAYVIYTSGSTGQPKGVLVEHRNAVNTLYALEESYPMGEEDAFLLKTPYSFDVSVTELFGWFFGRGRLVIMKRGEEKEPEKIIEAVTQCGVTHINFVPSMLDLFLEEIKPKDIPRLEKKLRYLFSAGEAITPATVQRFHSLFRKVRLENLYGPTEAAVYATGISLPRGQGLSPVTIGRPLANTSAYILDKQNRLCPPGIPGELCLAGAGIARGYLNHQDLTEKKYPADPFTPGERMYRTGDMARWTPGGKIEYLGRLDSQVKIRGNRVEPGEVEFCLQSHPEISKALVVDREDTRGSKYLAAYFLSGSRPSSSALRQHVSTALPSYMVPSYFMQLDSFPLSANGKLEKKRLPEPTEIRQTETEYTAPRNDREEEIDEIWQEVLGVERIGIHDNFFDIGGNSIKAIQVYSRLSEKYDIAIDDIFEYETIAALALHIHAGIEDFNKRLDKIRNRIGSKSPAPEVPFLMDEMEAYTKKNNRYLQVNLRKRNNYRQIFLTGATGYLGIYLFKELLETTDAVILPLVRGKTARDTEERLRQKFDYYFDRDLYRDYSGRIRILRGDMKQDRLGLSSETYAALAEQTDCIINCAANVRHYGHYHDFEEINVKGVKQLIRLAKEGQSKDLNHISTMSVGLAGIKEEGFFVFDEYTHPRNREYDNVYLRSKLKAEELVLKAREEDIRTNIFRIGTLVFHSKTGKFQENIGENAFYTSVKSYIKIGACPDVSHKSLDFSYVDYAARAIALLFNKKELTNEIHHVTNPATMSIGTLGRMIRAAGYPLEIHSLHRFLDVLDEAYNNTALQEYALNILLHSRIIEDTHMTRLIPMNWKTTMMLKQLDFNWPELDEKMIAKMLNYCEKVEFI